MSGIFKTLIETGIKIGTVTDAHMYNGGYINIEGVSHEGKKFSLSLHIKEEDKNDGN